MEDLVPPGMMKFEDTDLIQLLDIYQEISERTILRPQAIGWGKISVRTQTRLTRKEALWVMDALLFSQGGLSMVPESEKFVFALPSNRGNVPPKLNSPRAAPKTGMSALARAAMHFSDADLQQMVNL